MNWGLEISPKTNGFMAPARSPLSVDFVCHRTRRERERVRCKGRWKRESGVERLKLVTFEKRFAIQPASGVYYQGALSDVCRVTDCAEITAQSFDKEACCHSQDPNKGTKVLLFLSFFTLSSFFFFVLWSDVKACL